VCRNAPSVSHLLFADDSLILMKANMDNATFLQRVLDSYCENSGLVSSPKLKRWVFPKKQQAPDANVTSEFPESEWRTPKAMRPQQQQQPPCQHQQLQPCPDESPRQPQQHQHHSKDWEQRYSRHPQGQVNCDLL
jgi:hypothetical protein